MRPETLVKIEVPLYLQGVETSYCVPYSLLGIAHYFRIGIEEQDAIDVCGAHKTQGSHAYHYTKGVKKIGMKFKRLRFNYRNVRRSIEAGYPVAICYMINELESHFSTIIGARRDHRGFGFYLLNDTYYGRYEIPEEILKYLMRRDESWARIVEEL